MFVPQRVNIDTRHVSMFAYFTTVPITCDSILRSLQAETCTRLLRSAAEQAHGLSGIVTLIFSATIVAEDIVLLQFIYIFLIKPFQKQNLKSGHRSHAVYRPFLIK